MQTQTVSETQPTRKRPNTRYDVKRVAELAQKGLTQQEVADLTNLERSSVSRILSRYEVAQQEVEEFKGARNDIFAGLQMRICKSITDEDIKKAPLQVRLMGLGIVYDKERLETGQSTSNVSVHELKLDRDKYPPLEVR